MAGKGKHVIYWILLVVLVAGLGGFGVRNFGGSVRNVATVGQTEIDVPTYARALQAEMQAQSQASGKPMTGAEAQAAGVDRQVLQTLLGQASLDEAARMAGLSVGDDAVREQIVAIPAFQGADGKFDRSAYEMALQRNGLSTAEFEHQVRTELARNILQAALVSGLAPQPSYGDAVLKYLGEKAAITYAPVDAAALDAPVPAPTEDEIKAFYDANPDLFRLPERKAITYVWLTPEMVASQVPVDDAALHAAYDARRDEFVRPPRRMVDRLGFADDAAAEAAKSAIDSGQTTFDQLLADRKLSEEDVDLGMVEQSDLGDAGPAVFALDDTGVVGPLPSPVGPALFRVNAILTAQETPFEEARATLAEDLQQEGARDLLDGQREKLNDLLAGGATLEDLADKTDMQLGQITWTGSEDQGIAAYEGFRTAAETVTEDDYPEIHSLEDGALYAIRLDSVTPPEVPPLADVHDKAAELAQAKATHDALVAKATALAAQVSDGGDLAALGLTPKSLTGLTRRGVIAELPPGAIDTVFKLEPGKADVIAGADDAYVVRLDSVTPPDPAAPESQALRTAVDNQAAQGIASDLLTALAQSIEAKEGFTINQAAVNAVHSRLP
ncbi:MAG: SurA N-terminal domain-containing protein [Rhodobacteraceae bacterium]|nr:SurA N-terminal domain-containing protein [Paracoccaceae bacterium]